ncbi:macrophage mannose receptor 1-like isoform 1 [Aphelenchoides avenae]|nr:macrophage mannose receptor 1-like isoform 1 [Aphelenchus avenae]
MRSAFALLLLAATVLAECPDGWEKFGHNCYRVTDDPNVNSFDKHLANCRRQGALVQNQTPNTVYLGLYDAFKNGTWVWSDGTPVDYDNWDEGRPDNTDGAQFCSQLHGDRDGVWDDEDCCGNGIGICQIPDPDACPCPRNWTHLPQTGNCYKLDYNGTSVTGVITPRNWTEARNSCIAQGGDLVSVHSRAEEALLYALAGSVVDVNYENSIWIGLNITGTPAAWEWVDGTPLTQPNYFIQLDNPNSPCAAFVPRYAGNAVNGQTAGGWHDIGCNFPFKYAICQQKAHDLPAPSVSTAVNLRTVLLRANRVHAHEKAVINYGSH